MTNETRANTSSIRTHELRNCKNQTDVQEAKPGFCNRLVLFDVDHTLVNVGKAHNRSFAHAVETVYGVKVDMSQYSLMGKTDLQILHEILDSQKLPKDEKRIQETIQKMIGYFAEQDLSTGKMMPGVEKVLKELEKHKNIIIGLCTGNVEQIAYAKLNHFGIGNYFKLGGFGEISVVRSDLVKDAIKKTKKLGAVDSVLVIGDTPGDIKAAKDAHVESLAVATGTFKMEALKKHHPEHCVNNFEDPAAIQVILHG